MKYGIYKNFFMATEFSYSNNRAEVGSAIFSGDLPKKEAFLKILTPNPSGEQLDYTEFKELLQNFPHSEYKSFVINYCKAYEIEHSKLFSHLNSSEGKITVSSFAQLLCLDRRLEERMDTELLEKGEALVKLLMTGYQGLSKQFASEGDFRVFKIKSVEDYYNKVAEKLSKKKVGTLGSIKNFITEKVEDTFGIDLSSGNFLKSVISKFSGGDKGDDKEISNTDSSVDLFSSISNFYKLLGSAKIAGFVQIPLVSGLLNQAATFTVVLTSYLPVTGPLYVAYKLGYLPIGGPKIENSLTKGTAHNPESDDTVDQVGVSKGSLVKQSSDEFMDIKSTASDLSRNLRDNGVGVYAQYEKGKEFVSSVEDERKNRREVKLERS